MLPEVQGRSALLAALLVGLTLAAYLPVLGAGYVWDDDFHVTRNLTLRSLDGLRRIWLEASSSPQYYPMTNSSFWIEYQLWGLRPLGYHLVNVLLHAGSALLLWLVLRRLEVPGAWLGAALFALHPAHVESVAWITERKNTLSGFFALAAALVYLRFALGEGARARRAWTYAGALLLFLLALASKTVTCTLPVALALVLWWKRGRLRAPDLLPLFPWLALGAVLGSLTAWIERTQVGAAGREWSLTFAERLLLAGRALGFYLGKLLWPSNLVFVYPRWTLDASSARAWLYPLAAVATVATLWALRERIGKGPLVAALYFAVTLSPALGFFDVFPMLYSFVADHFQYLASIGPLTLFGAGCALAGAGLRARWRLPAALAPALAAVLLLSLGACTWSRSGVYRNAETLWRDTLSRNPGAWMAHNNLAVLLAGRGAVDEAEQHYRETLRLKPDYATAHDNLGGLLAGSGRVQEALDHFRRAVDLRPDDAGMRTNLAEALTLSGRVGEGLAEFSKALEAAPGDPKILFRFGSALAASGRHDEALPLLEEAVRLEPRAAEARFNLGTLCLRMGRYEEAVTQLAEALRLQPSYEKARRNLEVARAALARPRSAPPGASPPAPRAPAGGSPDR